MRKRMSLVHAIVCPTVIQSFRSLTLAIGTVLILVSPQAVRAAELHPGDIVVLTNSTQTDPGSPGNDATYGVIVQVDGDTFQQTRLASFSTMSWFGGHKSMTLHSDGFIYGTQASSVWRYNPGLNQLANVRERLTMSSWHWSGWVEYMVSLGSKIYLGASSQGSSLGGCEGCCPLNGSRPESSGAIITLDPTDFSTSILAHCEHIHHVFGLEVQNGKLIVLTSQIELNNTSFGPGRFVSIDPTNGQQTKILDFFSTALSQPADFAIDIAGDFIVLGFNSEIIKIDRHTGVDTFITGLFDELHTGPPSRPSKISVLDDGSLLVYFSVPDGGVGGNYLWRVDANSGTVQALAGFEEEVFGAHLPFDFNPVHRADFFIVPPGFNPPCQNNQDCQDNDACTVDTCEQGGCRHLPFNCSDDLFCNGLESCVAGSCQPGTPQPCNDGVACTIDSCNEEVDACDHVPNHSACDDGTFCNGVEICSATFGCEVGTDPCPGLTCNEDADACFCLSDIDCEDDGVFCNGDEICSGGTCSAHTGNPCSEDETCVELDDGFECLACVSATDCDDGIASNLDRCDEAKHTCSHGELVIEGKSSVVVGATERYRCAIVFDDDTNEDVTRRAAWRVVDADNPVVTSGCAVITDDGILTPREHCAGLQVNVECTVQEGAQILKGYYKVCICFPEDKDCCSLGDPAEQPVPDEDGDGVPNDTDLCPGTAAGEAADDSGCSTEGTLDGTSSGGGACGALGVISWTMLLPGFVRLRKMSLNGRGHRILR